VNTRNGALLVLKGQSSSSRVAASRGRGGRQQGQYPPRAASERVGDQWIVSGSLKPGERVIVEGLQKVKERRRGQPQAGERYEWR